MNSNARKGGAAAHRRLQPAILVGGVTLITVLTLGGCGGGDQREVDLDQDMGPSSPSYVGTGAFPVPQEIQPNVDFWRHVYGLWSRHQVAFHDDEHMGVIYEVTNLPSADDESFGESDRAFIRSRLQYHQDRVRSLQNRVVSNQPLSAEDQKLLAKFERAGGARALYGAADRVRSQRGMREKFRRGMEISGRYDKSFREIMRRNGLPEDLAYLPHVESSFQANAVSPVGASGIWQFMPATGRSFMNVNGAVDDRMDPIVAADGAARYLAQAHQRLGSWPLAVTSYNHGQGGMAKAKAEFGHDFGRIVKNYQGKAFKFDSRNYYAQFIAAREVAGNARSYFPEGVNYASPWPHERMVLRNSMPADQIARQYGVSTGVLASLNMHWRDAARDGRTLLPAGSTVWLPAGSKGQGGDFSSSYASPLIAARETPYSSSQPMTTAAVASMAYRATQTEPVFGDYSSSRPVAAPRAEQQEPRVARGEPKSVRSEPNVFLGEERATRSEPRVARVEPKAARSEPNVFLGEERATRSEPRVARVEPKPARSEPNIFLGEERAKAAESRVAGIEDAPARPKPRATWEEEELRSEPRIAMDERQPVPSEPRTGMAELDQPLWSGASGGESAPALPAAAPELPDTSLALSEEERELTGLRSVEVAPSYTRPAPRFAKFESKAVRSEPRVARTEAPAARPEVKTAHQTDTRPVRSETRTARAEAKVEKAEARTAKADAKGSKAEARTAKADAKGVKAVGKTAKADAKTEKAEARTAKADTKGAKVDAKTAKADTKGAKADAKTAKTAKTAKVDAKADKADTRTAKADAKGAKTAKTDPKGTKADAKTAKAEKSADAAGSKKVHVVKPQETLFRVASGNGISVAELRRLNKLSPSDNNVRPGQKLKVGT
jgi:membrane-bound lytic murein transglycosylase D